MILKGEDMLKHRNLISYILLCIAMLMCCIAAVLISITVDQLKSEVSTLKEQNESIQYRYELQKQGTAKLSEVYQNYASETDAKIDAMGEDIQKLALEKEVLEKELHKQQQEQEAKPTSTVVGTYQLTAYVATGNPCADGQYPQVGYTAACNDPNLWHKWIHIEGYGDFYVHDTGGMSSNVIDLFVGSYDEAIQFGRRSAVVSIINNGGN